jgi:hypothetical protein
MPTARLSAKLIENIKSPLQGRADYWDSLLSEDDALPGSFGLRVFASGVKSWQIMYRVPQRSGALRQKRMTLGSDPAFGLSEAREMAREALRKVARGTDPAEDRKSTRAKIAATPTVEEAAREFIAQYVKPRNRSWRETERIFNYYVLPRRRILPHGASTCANWATASTPRSILTVSGGRDGLRRRSSMPSFPSDPGGAPGSAMRARRQKPIRCSRS